MQTKTQLKNELNAICEKYNITIDWEKYQATEKTVKAGISIGDLSLTRQHNCLMLVYRGRSMGIDVREYSREYCLAIMELINNSEVFKTFVSNYQNGINNNDCYSQLNSISREIRLSIEKLLHQIKCIEQASQSIVYLQEQMKGLQKSLAFQQSLDELNN